MPASRPPSDPSGRLPTQPAIARPRSAVLDPIEEEGISWEGQVLVVGQDGDVAALLFVTTERIILTGRDGAILLESPRNWLVPAPLVVAENGVRLSITPAGEVPGPDTTERLHLRITEGRGPAVQLVAILTGRASLSQMAEGSWNAQVGAGRANMLPALPAFETRQDTRPVSPARTADPDPETRGVAPISDWRPRHPERGIAPESLRAPEPEPVEATSRAGRFLTQRAADVPAANDSVTSIEEERRKRGAGLLVWTSRVAVLALVVLVAGWFGRQYIPERVADQLPASVSGYLALNDDGPERDGTIADAGDGTNGPENDPADIMPTEVALGVGGGSTVVPDGEGGETMAPLGEIPTPTPPADSNEAPSDDGDTANQASEPEGDQPDEVDNSDQPDDVDNSDHSDEIDNGDHSDEIDNGDQGSEPPTVPVETHVPEPTAPADQTIVAETPEPTVPADQTIVAETPAPTTEPEGTEPPAPTATPDGTPGVVETVAPIATPDAPLEPTLEPQQPSVNPDDPPEQAFADQGFRYRVEGAATGTSIEELPEVAEVSYGEWIVLAVSGTNWTSSDQVFDMARFSLLADGQPIQLDVGNSWVASLLSYSPAYGNTDAILWAPGEEHQFVLTFLAPKDAGSLVLQIGDQQFDLGSVLSDAPTLLNANQGTAPETIDATVVDVVDGETIVIEKDGVEQQLRYLGIDVPTGDDCFAGEATEANRALVEGKSVKIERQATNVDAQGNWVRDVWVETDAGTYVLVAHQLVKEGAAEADISQPNTRFTGWLRGAEAVAKAESLGLWGACKTADGSNGVGAASTIPVALFRHVGVLA